MARRVDSSSLTSASAFRLFGELDVLLCPPPLSVGEGRIHSDSVGGAMLRPSGGR